MCRLALSRAGHDVHIANDGVAALRTASSQHPDILFLEIRMPNMDGIEVLRNLESVNRTRDILIVMLSSHDEPGIVRETLSLGAKQCVLKAGTNPADLEQIISQWVKEPE
jgi:CheY-like chemotaxis protein